jgi:hypothetical protein
VLRHIFVEERMSNERVDGPQDKGASMVMGHSLKMWGSHYDTQYHGREAQNAVDGMDRWRDNLIGEGPSNNQGEEWSDEEDEWEDEWEEDDGDVEMEDSELGGGLTSSGEEDEEGYHTCKSDDM